jgi:hypothetical protein
VAKTTDGMSVAPYTLPMAGGATEGLQQIAAAYKTKKLTSAAQKPSALSVCKLMNYRTPKLPPPRPTNGCFWASIDSANFLKKSVTDSIRIPNYFVERKSMDAPTLFMYRANAPKKGGSVVATAEIS